MTRQLCYVISYLRSVLVNDRNQYPMGLAVLLRCACDNTHSIWTSHASVSRVMCPVEFGSVRTDSDMSASYRKFRDFNSSSLTGANVFCWVFCIFAFKGAAMRAKFGTNRQKTLHSSRKQWSSVKLVRGCNPLMALVV